MIDHKTLEILVSVARMPRKYRLARKEELRREYSRFLTCDYAQEAFEGLLESSDTLSREGAAVLASIKSIAAKDMAAMDSMAAMHAG